MQITPARKWKVQGDKSRLSRTYSLPFKERNLGCTVIDLVMKIKSFKEVNTKARCSLLKKE